jgi:hypothetical protein
LLGWLAVFCFDWQFKEAAELTWSLTCAPSTATMRAPNSTPMVRSWTGWKRLSVNWRRRQDLPTPVSPMMMYLRARGEGSVSGAV